MPVKHVFVLMLENRSFDHLFGMTQRQATPIPPAAGVTQDAPDRCPSDPPHEFDNVRDQINDGAMDGFPNAIQKSCFKASQLPTLNELASRYVLFDNWYSSVPAPTWPNRFFVHAASSGGLCTSPTGLRTFGAIVAASEHFKFDNGTLFDLIDKANPKAPAWRVYHGDVTPQCLALPGMVGKYYKGNDYFRTFYPTNAPDGSPRDDGFASDVTSSGGYAPKYTFIEPNYALQALTNFDFTTGDSMHPCGLASAGDNLVRYVYQTLSGSPIWNNSVLLILWDEHGGFYDHVGPPTAVPPGDVEHNRAQGDDGVDFHFDRLGVRVPAILVGPSVPQQKLGSELFPGQFFDHASVVSTVRSLFSLGGPLTARDGSAPTWDGCVVDSPTTAAVGAAPADFALTSKAVVAKPAPKGVKAASSPTPASGPAYIDGFAAGMGLIAMNMDRVGAAVSGEPPVGDFTPKTAEEFHAAREASLNAGDFPTVLNDYMVAVRARAAAVKAAATSN